MAQTASGKFWGDTEAAQGCRTSGQLRTRIRSAETDVLRFHTRAARGPICHRDGVSPRLVDGDRVSAGARYNAARWTNPRECGAWSTSGRHYCRQLKRRATTGSIASDIGNRDYGVLIQGQDHRIRRAGTAGTGRRIGDRHG